MTRINVISPKKLTDQHLFAEFREITRVSALARHIRPRPPQKYCMGTDHIKFFYDKGQFLSDRLDALQLELTERSHVKFTPKTYKLHASGLNNPWFPDLEDKLINLIRLDSKVRQSPGWYTHYTHKVTDDFYLKEIIACKK